MRQIAKKREQRSFSLFDSKGKVRVLECLRQLTDCGMGVGSGAKHLRLFARAEAAIL
jgi:hypothetical protein